MLKLKPHIMLIDGQAIISSIFLAEFLKKTHSYIIQVIDNLDISKACRTRCFYKLETNCKISYKINQEGFLILLFYGIFKRPQASPFLEAIKLNEDSIIYFR